LDWQGHSAGTHGQYVCQPTGQAVRCRAGATYVLRLTCSNGTAAVAEGPQEKHRLDHPRSTRSTLRLAAPHGVSQGHHRLLGTLWLRDDTRQSAAVAQNLLSQLFARMRLRRHDLHAEAPAATQRAPKTNPRTASGTTTRHTQVAYFVVIGTRLFPSGTFCEVMAAQRGLRCPAARTTSKHTRTRWMRACGAKYAENEPPLYPLLPCKLKAAVWRHLAPLFKT
jgi:hypothetical protein